MAVYSNSLEIFMIKVRWIADCSEQLIPKAVMILQLRTILSVVDIKRL